MCYYKANDKMFDRSNCGWNQSILKFQSKNYFIRVK